MDSKSPIGIFDSGLGGLTVYRELKLALPNESFIYLGDKARSPYGTKAPSTIIRYSLDCANFLLQKRVKLIVVACNTASSCALPNLQDDSGVPIFGVIDSAVKEALSLGQSQKIGVVGTSATVSSEVYQQRLNQLDPKVKVLAKACPLFVPFVEEGIFEGELIDQVVEYYLSELKSQQIQSLILGCTHYPLISKAISNYFDNAVQIVECSRSVASEVRGFLEAANLNTRVKGQEDRFYFTDAIAPFNRLANFFLNSASAKAEFVELN